MNSSEYRHVQHEAIARRVQAGFTDKAVADDLHVDRRAVARVRRIIGMKPVTNSTTMQDKLDRFTGEPDAEGHVTWTGRTSRNGTPIIRHLNSEIPAARVAFERRTGREAVGMCRAECDVKHCVADRHVMDDLGRRTIRAMERSLHGLPVQPWTECPEGHLWLAHGRFEPDLTPFCRACNTERARRSRETRDDKDGN